jgi:hypothetical protein
MFNEIERGQSNARRPGTVVMDAAPSLTRSFGS